MARIVLLIAWLALASPVWPDAESNADQSQGVHSAKAFDAWLLDPVATGHSRAQEYAAFVRFLDEQGVRDVVPPWQLLRTDADYAARCGLSAFAMPPRKQWQAIIPTLKLIESDIKPAVGPVEVNSAWRSPELNACVRGASASRHLAFSAVDLIAQDRRDRNALFSDLCALHKRIGPQSSMGLGAYYDPNEPRKNVQGRFHIDVTGYRQWGFDYSAASSGCQFIG